MMFVLVFQFGLKAPKCRLKHVLVEQKKYFYNLKSISNSYKWQLLQF